MNFSAVLNEKRLSTRSSKLSISARTGRSTRDDVVDISCVIQYDELRVGGFKLFLCFRRYQSVNSDVLAQISMGAAQSHARGW